MTKLQILNKGDEDNLPALLRDLFMLFTQSYETFYSHSSNLFQYRLNETQKCVPTCH